MNVMFVKKSDRKSYLYESLHQLGYDNLLPFLRVNPQLSYETLAQQLNQFQSKDFLINAYDIKIFHQDESIDCKQFRYATKDALVRFLNSYAVNWKRKNSSIKNRTNAYVEWTMFVRKKREAIAKQIWDYLEEQIPPNYNWLPESPDDPLITAAFDKFWPEDQ
jgi:hypothetical protein